MIFLNTIILGFLKGFFLIFIIITKIVMTNTFYLI